MYAFTKILLTLLTIVAAIYARCNLKVEIIWVIDFILASLAKLVRGNSRFYIVWSHFVTLLRKEFQVTWWR